VNFELGNTKAQMSPLIGMNKRVMPAINLRSTSLALSLQLIPGIVLAVFSTAPSPNKHNPIPKLCCKVYGKAEKETIFRSRVATLPQFPASLAFWAKSVQALAV